jgi:hypothetical protein
MMKTKDGDWVYCDCPTTYKDRLIEVKCPYSKQESGLDDKKSSAKFYLRKVGDNYELDMTSAQARV